MSARQEQMIFNGAMLGIALIGLYVMTKGLKGAAKDAGSAVGGAAVGAVTGVIGGAADEINATINKGVQMVTGDQTQTLGGWIYDILHPQDGMIMNDAPQVTRQVPSKWKSKNVTDWAL